MDEDFHHVLAGGRGGKIRLWNLEKGKLVRAVVHSTEPIFSVAFMWGEVRRQALSGAYDGSIKFWDLRSGQCLCTWSGHHTGAIACMSVDLGPFSWAPYFE